MRNPNYGGSRPQRLREIHYTIGVAPAQSVADVEAGRSDYPWRDPTRPRLDAELTARYGPASAAARNGRQRYFVSPCHGLGFLELNTSRPLFSDVRLRKAVNYAIDRRALARLGHARLSADLPCHPHGPVPPADDARRQPRTALPARRRPARGAPTCPERSRNRRPLHVQPRATAGDTHGGQVEPRSTRPGRRDQRVRLPRGIRESRTPGEPYDIFISHWYPDYVDPASFLDLLRDQRIEPRLTPTSSSAAPASPETARYARLLGALGRARAGRGTVGRLCDRHLARLLLRTDRLPGIPAGLRHRPRRALHALKAGAVGDRGRNKCSHAARSGTDGRPQPSGSGSFRGCFLL